MTKEELIAFETEIAERFNHGQIPYPIHLSDGNEDQLIEIFKNVNTQDWVFSTWRSHYHALLHGIPPEKVMNAIMNGHSIALCFPEYRFISSAIVGGCLPIALGVALGIKRQPKTPKPKVWIFVGDMTAHGGACYEVAKYSWCHDLSLEIVIEDNGISVCTPTNKVWGDQVLPYYKAYTYINNKYPHSGAGKRVEF